MNKTGFILLTLTLAPFQTLHAQSVTVPAAMQRCEADSDCTFIPTSCTTPCDQTPINKKNADAINRLKSNRCEVKTTTCENGETKKPTCINGHCRSIPAYKPGAYPAAEAPVPYQGNNDYAHINDTDGNFSAYDLPTDIVHQNIMGQYSFPSK